MPSFPAYGRLSRRTREEMIDGARVEVAPYKRDPADFVLWKPSSPEQPGWDSPYGRGRPGWHIECSAMIEAHLGTTIDIHGGGQDLRFPHHENEIAQSSCAHGGAPLARFWVHNGFLNVDREKMAKSVGNVLLVRDLLREAPGEAIRFALLSTHYRKPLDWTSGSLPQARQALDRLYRTLEQLPGSDRQSEAPPAVLAALEDDLNTPKAFAELFALAHRANTSSDDSERRDLKAQLLAAGSLLGLLGQDPAAWFQETGASSLEPAEIERLIEARSRRAQRQEFCRGRSHPRSAGSRRRGAGGRAGEDPLAAGGLAADQPGAAEPPPGVIGRVVAAPDILLDQARVTQGGFAEAAAARRRDRHHIARGELDVLVLGEMRRHVAPCRRRAAPRPC